MELCWAARVRDVRNKMESGQRDSERSEVSRKMNRTGRWIVMQASANGEEVQCQSCPERGSMIYSCDKSPQQWKR